MSQKVWIDGELVDNPWGLNRKDVEELQRWKRITVDCPYCLLRAPLNLFATFNRGTRRYPKKLSRNMMKCPGCGQRMRWTTLKRCTEQSVEEFAWWFWENAFLYRGMERVDTDSFFARVKMWRYEDRQAFWAVYHEFKDARDPKDVQRTEDDYEDYLKTCGPEEDEEWTTS